MDSVSRQRGEGFVVVGQMVPQESNCEGLALGKIRDTIFFSLVKRTDCHIKFHQLSYLILFCNTAMCLNKWTIQA